MTRRDCGFGWYSLIDGLELILSTTDPDMKPSQIKEKFGGLRYYTDKSPSKAGAKAISFAEALSLHICEICGEPGGLSGKGWTKTLCPIHAKERS